MPPVAWKMRSALPSLGLLLLLVHRGQTQATCADTSSCDNSPGFIETNKNEDGTCTVVECLTAETFRKYRHLYDVKPTKDRPWIRYGYITDPEYPFQHPVLVDDEEEMTCEVAATKKTMAPSRIELVVDPSNPPLSSPTLNKVFFGNNTVADKECLLIVKTTRKLEDNMHGQKVTCKMFFTDAGNPMAEVNDTYTHYAFRMTRPVVSRVGSDKQWKSDTIQGEVVTYKCETEDVTFDEPKQFKQAMKVNEGQYRIVVNVQNLEVTKTHDVIPNRYKVSNTISFKVTDAFKENQFLVTCRSKNSVLDPTNPNVEVSYPYLTDVGPIVIDRTDTYISIGAACGALSLVLAFGLLYYYTSAHASAPAEPGPPVRPGGPKPEGP